MYQLSFALFIFQIRCRDKKKKRRGHRSKSTSPHKNAIVRVPGSATTQVNGEVEVTTTIRTKGKNIGSVMVRPHSTPPPLTTSGAKAQASLNLLKDLKKIQTKLRKDDISWDD